MIVTSARANYQSRQRPASAGEAYEVCLRSDERGADLISDALPFGRPLYGEPNAPIDFSKVSVQSSQIAKQLVRRLALRPISPMFVSLITQRTLCPQPRRSRVSIVWSLAFSKKITTPAKTAHQDLRFAAHYLAFQHRDSRAASAQGQ